MKVSLPFKALVPALVLVTWSTPIFADVGEEIVRFRSHDGMDIGCLLSFPDDEPGPFPGMLMIPGAGLHDADVTVDQPELDVTRGAQALFRPLARFFSRNGWAVLRCNKRGASFGHRHDRPEWLERSNLDELVQDAHDALEKLKSDPRVDARPLVVLGHSEGTWIAYQLAIGRTDIDLLVSIGSVARGFDELLEYQLVDRNLEFLHRAADRNRDGYLTLAELDALDGHFGLGSIYVRNSSQVLYDSPDTVSGSSTEIAFNPKTDRNGDGRLHIDSEVEDALRDAARAFLDAARGGGLGEYWRSLTLAPPSESFIESVETPILFVHGALDVQTPLEEAITLMTRLESGARTDYSMLVFPDLGHSLSRPNDYFRGDGGLSTLDNLTLNAPRAKTRRELLDHIEAMLAR